MTTPILASGQTAQSAEEAHAHTRELIRETISYVLGQSPDVDTWLSHSRRLKSKELNSRTFTLRLAIIVLGTLSLCIDATAIGLSVAGSDLSNLKVIARTIALIAAFLLTIITTVVGGGGGSLQSFVLLTTACLLLDAPMTTLLDQSSTLFIVGIVAIIIRIAATLVGLWGVNRTSKVPLTEALYLHIVDEPYIAEANAFEDAVEERLMSNMMPRPEDATAGSSVDHSGGGSDGCATVASNETFVKKQILAAMVQQMEVLYEEYRGVFLALRDGGGDLNEDGRDLNTASVPMMLTEGRKRPSNPDMSMVRLVMMENQQQANSNGNFAAAAAAANNSSSSFLTRRKSRSDSQPPPAINVQPQMLNWLRLMRFREAMHAHDNFSTNLILLLLFVLFLLTAGNVGFEFWKIFANQSPLFPNGDGFIDRDHVRRASFPARQPTGLKVHVVVVDGLRDDFTTADGSALGEYVNSAAFKPDSLKFSARAQLPSFSVPNWMTILSGSPPEDSGVTGNLQNGETYYDTIYSIAKAYGVHAGMTGTPWWADLVASSLPPLGGDGTIATSERPSGVAEYEWSSADLADDMRGAVAVQAAHRSTVPNPFGSVDPSVTNLYELFLTHFSDVDMQGHDYGIDTKYNKRDSYRGAVANKTELIKNIVGAIDSDTVLIITSDHGHVMRGGHGGEDDVLRDIPLIFYKKGSGVGSAPAGSYDSDCFLPTEVPRSNFHNKYSNLDLSATITALLGLPSPRQSLGVFVEEALNAFLPSAIAANSTEKLRFYHDLLLAKIALVKEYKALLDDTFFSSAVPKVLQSDPLVAQFASEDAAVPFTPQTALGSEREYADLIRIVLGDYKTLRDRRFDIVFWRNFALSVCVAVPSLIILGTAFSQSAFARTKALVDPKHPNFAMNWVQCAGALVTISLYTLFTIVTYLIIYYEVVGQRQWDPTAVHTPSVAVRYLASVLVSPIIYFTIFTKLWLWGCNCIHWRIPEAMAEFQALKRKFNIFFIFRWMSHHVPRDLATILLVTRQFKPSQFLKAHLYTQYLALFVVFLSLVLLFLCFPFTFFLPIVFNVSHVSEFNTVYRFRIITIMFMGVPLQVGTMLMLWLKPRSGAAEVANARMWDLAMLEGRLAGDAYEMKRALVKDSASTTSSVVMAAGGSGGNNTTTRQRRSVMLAASFQQEQCAKQHGFIVELMALIQNPLYRTNPLAANYTAGDARGGMNTAAAMGDDVLSAAAAAAKRRSPTVPSAAGHPPPRPGTLVAGSDSVTPRKGSVAVTAASSNATSGQPPPAMASEEVCAFANHNNQYGASSNEDWGAAAEMKERRRDKAASSPSSQRHSNSNSRGSDDAQDPHCVPLIQPTAALAEGEGDEDDTKNSGVVMPHEDVAAMRRSSVEVREANTL